MAERKPGYLRHVRVVAGELQVFKICDNVGHPSGADTAGNCKPEGVAVELCDAVMRIMDFLAFMGVDIEAVLMAKHEYNKGREYRHGGKRA